MGDLRSSWKSLTSKAHRRGLFGPTAVFRFIHFTGSAGVWWRGCESVCVCGEWGHNATDPTGRSLMGTGFTIATEMAVGFAFGKLMAMGTTLFWSCRQDPHALGANMLGSGLVSGVFGVVGAAMGLMFPTGTAPIGMMLNGYLGGIANYPEYVASARIQWRSEIVIVLVFRSGHSGTRLRLTYAPYRTVNQDEVNWQGRCHFLASPRV